ncbi:hypothetical protein CRYUN_Cryun01aG0198900 [Craigia yunnanensis]
MVQAHLLEFGSSSGLSKRYKISGVTLKPKAPTKAACAEHLELRKEILTLLNLQKQICDYGNPAPFQLVGKKEQKRKGPGRVSETPSSPAHKRPRKLKASDLKNKRFSIASFTDYVSLVFHEDIAFLIRQIHQAGFDYVARISGADTW